MMPKLNKHRTRLLAPRVSASKRILAPMLGNGIPLSFIFSLRANNLLVGKRLLAPRVGASKSKEILAPRLENGIPWFFLLSLFFFKYFIGTTVPKNLNHGV